MIFSSLSARLPRQRYPEYENLYIRAAFGSPPYLAASPGNPLSRTSLLSPTQPPADSMSTRRRLAKSHAPSPSPASHYPLNIFSKKSNIAYTLPHFTPQSLPSILISHCPTDTFVSSSQALALKARLEGLGLKDVVVYEGDRLGKSGTDGTQDGLLRSEEFGRLVREWLKRRPSTSG